VQFSSKIVGGLPVGGSAVNNTLFLTDSSNAYGILFGTIGTNGHSWIQSQRVDGLNTQYPIYINPLGGSVLIGTTTVAGFRLDVNGTARVQSTLKVGAATTQNASAVLDVESTTQGFLPPRMTNAQRLAIASPAIGLIVYCTDTTEGLYINKSTGWTFII
jgi:hypothetical protein